MTTDTSERGLERLICTALTGSACDPGAVKADAVRERPAAYGAGWICGAPEDYDREYCVDLAQLSAFLRETQPEVADALDLGQDGPTRRKFLARLQGEITKRGTIDVLRHGLKHGPHQLDLFYGTPSPGNAKAAERYAQNRFSVTRQLRYSRDETQRALDLGLFINGLPVATFELKNSLTKQTVADAVEQYQRDRDPREKLFEFGRCVAHFAVDDHEVRFCTHLKGKGSWFLPFNQGWNDGAGNPPNPNGLKTDYLWKRVLTRDGLTDILENYAQVVETKDDKTGKKKPVQIWPRFHQLDVVRPRVEAALQAARRCTRHRVRTQWSAGVRHHAPSTRGPADDRGSSRARGADAPLSWRLARSVRHPSGSAQADVLPAGGGRTAAAALQARAIRPLCRESASRAARDRRAPDRRLSRRRRCPRQAVDPGAGRGGGRR